MDSSLNPNGKRAGELLTSLHRPAPEKTQQRSNEGRSASPKDLLFKLRTLANLSPTVEFFEIYAQDIFDTYAGMVPLTNGPEHVEKLSRGLREKGADPSVVDAAREVWAERLNLYILTVEMNKARTPKTADKAIRAFVSGLKGSIGATVTPDLENALVSNTQACFTSKVNPMELDGQTQLRNRTETRVDSLPDNASNGRTKPTDTKDNGILTSSSPPSSTNARAQGPNKADNSVSVPLAAPRTHDRLESVRSRVQRLSYMTCWFWFRNMECKQGPECRYPHEALDYVFVYDFDLKTSRPFKIIHRATLHETRRATLDAIEADSRRGVRSDSSHLHSSGSNWIAAQTQRSSHEQQVASQNASSENRSELSIFRALCGNMPITAGNRDVFVSTIISNIEDRCRRYREVPFRDRLYDDRGKFSDYSLDRKNSNGLFSKLSHIWASGGSEHDFDADTVMRQVERLMRPFVVVNKGIFQDIPDQVLSRS